MPLMEETTDRLSLFEDSRVAAVAVKMVENSVSHVMENQNSPFLIINGSCGMCVVVLFVAKTANRFFFSFYE
jgi:hypothetical protein